MHLSKFGTKFTEPIGINELMEDLGKALSSGSDILMLGGGNPSHIPAIQTAVRERLDRILASPGAFERMIGEYDTPQGKAEFLDALAQLLNAQFGWGLTADNIALTHGSQSSFFCLFNMLAGEFCEGDRKRILFPLTPEYIGYADVGLTTDFFAAVKPEIELLEWPFFKYRVDVAALNIDDSIGAVCLSRPTNPTGNVVTDDELAALAGLTRKHRLPLIVDNAYGAPFPNILFTDVHPVWDEELVLCMSLSKFGLPTLRTGIVIARPEIIRILSGMTAVLSLAPGSVGPMLALDMVRDGSILALSQDIIRPFYERKMRRAVNQLKAELEGLDVRIHKPEGAMFLWLWFPRMPVTSQELYERLKARGVLVVPGHYFFPGADSDWSHRHECIRVTYAQDDAIVEKGLSIIAEEARKIL